MPPLQCDDNRRGLRGGPLTASMNAPSSPTAESDDSFARDFFGSKRKQPVKKGTWFSKRNLKLDESEGDDSNKDSNDSLRDPLNLPHMIKRDTRKPPLQQKQQSYKSDETFDYDYANFGRRTYYEEQCQQQHYQQEQPKQLKTMQEHVKKRHVQENSGDGSSQAQKATSWAAKPAPTLQHSWDDSSSFTPTHTNDYQHTDQFNPNLWHNQRDRPQPNVQSHDKREHIRQLGRQNTPNRIYPQQHNQEQYYDDQLYSNAHLQHPQSQSDEWDTTNLIHEIISSTEARGEDGELLSRDQLLTELGIRLDEREIASQMHEQRRLAESQLHQQPPIQHRHLNTAQDSYQQLEQEHTRESAKLPDDQTWIQDVLQSASKGNIPSDVLDALVINAASSNNQNSQLQGQHRSSVESWIADVLHTAEKEHYSRQVLETLMESASRDSAKETQNLPLQGYQRNSVYSWLVYALQSAKREGYSSDALKALVDSVSDINFEDTARKPIEQENPLKIDRNSTDSWIADAQQSGAAPEVIEELLRVNGGNIGHDHSKKKQFSSSKPKHHSIFIRDSRGPVPTDDMLNESLISFEGSGSSGSRLVGDDVLLLQRNNPVTNVRAKSETSEDIGTSYDLAVTAHELLDQIGPDVDIESIPGDVLKAFGLTRNELRRADSSNAHSRDSAVKQVGSVKNNEESNPPISKACDSVSKKVYRQTSSPDDEVSWVENEQPFTNTANATTTDATRAREKSSSEMSSRVDSLSLSQRELHTDTRVPISEAEILEEAFSGSSRDGLSSSLKNLMNGVQNESNEQNEFSLTSSIDNNASDVEDEVRPSLGFMRHMHNSSGIHSNVSRTTSQAELEMEVRKKRMEVLATIEKSKQHHVRHGNHS